MTDHVACEHCGSISEMMTATLEHERITFAREVARLNGLLSNARVDKMKEERGVSEVVKKVLDHWAVVCMPHAKVEGITSCNTPYSENRVKAVGGRLNEKFSPEQLMRCASAYAKRPYCRYGQYSATGKPKERKCDAVHIFKNETTVNLGLAMAREDEEASKPKVEVPLTRDAFAELVAVLEARGLKQGREWRCPAHDDRKGSLTLKRGERGALVECHAGCAKEDVVGAVGWSMADLFDEAPLERKDRGRIEETYAYTDENGDLLYEVVRFDPKDFRQRRPDGRGGWEWSLNGTRRVLFRLPSVIRAVQEGRLIWVVEGERDVLALEAAGHVATCNSGGAGKWRHEHSAVLRGAKVAVIADNDEPGITHAQVVAALLRSTGAEVKVGLPAVGKDVSDHLAAGKTVGEFLPIKETA